MSRKRDRVYYRKMFRTCQPLEESRKPIHQAFTKLLSHWSIYRETARIGNTHVAFVGLVAHMECGSSLKRILPDGREYSGEENHWPFDAAIAIEEWLAQERVDWLDIPSVLKQLERFNGLGYARRGVHSPYLWSGSRHGVGTGKFTRDGEYDPEAVSKQIGAGVVLHEMVLSGIVLCRDPPLEYDGLGERIGYFAAQFQGYLNNVNSRASSLWRMTSLRQKQGLNTPLVLDGWLGPKTSNAARAVLGRYLVGDPRQK